jgi:hypothetical protein
MRSVQFLARAAGGPAAAASSRRRIAAPPRNFVDLLQAARAVRNRVLLVWAWAAARAVRRAGRQLSALMRGRGALRQLVTRTVYLEFEQLLVLEDVARVSVEVVHGAIWLTREDDVHDYLLTHGERLLLKGNRRWVGAALSATRLKLSGPLARSRIAKRARR